LVNRYGWCPDEYVAPDEPRYDWLRHFPSGYSITHLEMYVQSLSLSLSHTHTHTDLTFLVITIRHYAVLRDPAKARGFFYMRDPTFERSVPNSHVKDFEVLSAPLFLRVCGCACACDL
jgi:hypothetical protein